MSLAKKSQLSSQDLDGFSVPSVPPVFDIDEPEELPVESPSFEPPSVFAPEPERLPSFSDEAQPMATDDNYLADGEGAILLQVDEEPPQMLTFELPLVPGGEFQEDLEEPAEIEVVEEDDDIQVESDPWAWQVGSFLEWLSDKMQGVPRHSGRDSAGLERAMSYLEALDREISKAVRADINGEIDISKVEEARTAIYNGIERLQKRLETIQDKIRPKKKSKKKKKADEENDMVKEAQKATHVGGIIVTVPLLISSIARTCVNSMVSAGKDIEDVFDKLAAKYELTPREEMETIQLLADMGYPMRRPRGYKRDEEIDYTSTDNFDWLANYPG